MLRVLCRVPFEGLLWVSSTPDENKLGEPSLSAIPNWASPASSVDRGVPLRGVEDEEDIGVPLAAERGVDSEPPEPMEGHRYLLRRVEQEWKGGCSAERPYRRLPLYQSSLFKAAPTPADHKRSLTNHCIHPQR